MLKVGDKVKVARSEPCRVMLEDGHCIEWLQGKYKYLGKIYTVKIVADDGTMKLDDADNWWFHEKWLDKIGGDKMKNVWDVIVIDKTKDEIVYGKRLLTVMKSLLVQR